VVVVALVNVALTATISVVVRFSMVARADEMALDIVPTIEEAVIEPPVMVGFVMVVLERLSMRCDSATALYTAEVCALCCEDCEKISERSLSPAG